MILNKIEFLAMNNPIRAFIQEYIEIKRLRKLSSLPAWRKVLEIGCGNGNGVRLIRKYFSPKFIYAIDLDERMIKIAKEKNAHSSTKFELASATKLCYEQDYFDAIFDFWIIHHIPNWRNCIDELYRVLKPGGEIILEDYSLDTFSTFFWRFLKRVLKHPYDDMYTEEEFITYLKTKGFSIEQEKKYSGFFLLRHFIVIAKK